MKNPMNTEKKPLSQFVESAYLDYSLYVILDRALPNIRDGLKPVQRRIIYAMSELGLSAPAKPKKSARTVGDVIGKYHPHGDSACYEAMVHLAQDFSCRYPLIDGQGNWGSIDEPKSFAAMRYTESRLSPYAKTLLQELETVDFKQNFDATLNEPEYLPARLPNILLNGATGIAVGMATTILPHHLGELASACQALLRNNHLNLEELLNIVPAPDFPTGGLIVSQDHEIKQLYATGKGTIRVRAKYRQQDNQIIIDELPYQTSGSKIQEQIAKQLREKKIPALEDLRDESDHENPVRLVLLLKNNKVDSEKLMEHLFATTDLEKRFSSQMNVIGLDGKPQIKNLKEILLEWLDFRKETVKKRLNNQLNKIEKRLEIVRALRLVYLNLNETIKIIREEDNPESALFALLGLNANQIKEVLNIRLRQLAKLEEQQLLDEQNKLLGEQQNIQQLLNEEALFLDYIIDELEHDKKTYGDKRKSILKPTAQAQAQSWESNEPLTVIISQMAWIRSAKGLNIDGKSLSYKTGDDFLLQVSGYSNQTLALLLENGRLYNLSLNQLPSARGYGEPLSSQLQWDNGVKIIGAQIIEQAPFYLLINDGGAGFICPQSELFAKNKTGKIMITQNSAFAVYPLNQELLDNGEIFIQTNQGLAGLVKINELPQMNKGKGNQIINISKKSYDDGVRIIQTKIIPPNMSFILRHKKEQLMISEMEKNHYRVARGHKGLLLPKIWHHCEIDLLENH